jgi:low temperature requirement protein LtrA
MVLAAQYGLVLFHARHHRRGRTALMFAVGLHLLPAIGYLVAAFAVTKHRDNHLLLIWYILGFFEMAAILIHATFSKTLSFEGTHFNERLNLLTLIILGEGVIILAGNIGKIVEYTYVQEISRHWCE